MQLNDYTVHFHFEKETTLPKSGKQVPAIFCTIHPGPCATPARPCNTAGSLSRFTQCSPKDQFKAVTGRKIALRRALIALGLDWDQRKQLWDVYLLKMGKPKTRRRG